MKKHLAIFSKDAVQRIFSGEKTIETRFSESRIAPFGRVSIGDLVYIKPSGEDIAGQFTVKKVISIEGLEKSDLFLIQNEYLKQISFGSMTKDQEYFQLKSKARFGTLIFIDRVERFITAPVKINKKDQRGWVVLE